MAFLIKNGVIINDERELVGVSTAGITTALYVGENIQLDAQSGVITATKYAGSGADLTDIVATVIVSDGIPTGISTVEGDLYYDSTDLTLFTYYDNNWVDAAPVPPGATELDITNAAGISTVSIDLLTESLKLDGTANQVSVTLNPGTDGVSFGLESEVAIAGSMTAANFYGDGSGLTNLNISADQYLNLLGLEAGIVTTTNALVSQGEAFFTGAGIGLSVSNNALIEGSLEVSTNIDVEGNLRADTIEAIGLGTIVSFADNVNPFTTNAYDLGSSTNEWKDLYLAGKVSAGGSITANEYYGDGSNLTGVLSTDGGGDADLTGKLTVEELSVTSSGIALTVTDSVSAGGSITANAFYGDGSNLDGIGLSTTSFYEVAGVQAGIVTVSDTLDLNGNIVGNFTNLVSGINTIQTVDLTVNSLGTLKFNDAESTDGAAFMDFRTGSSAELALRLGSDLNPASSLYHLGEPAGAGTRISTQDDGIRFSGLIQIGQSSVAGAGASEQGLRFGFGASGQIVTEISTDLSGTNLDSELVTALAVENALGAFNTGSATTVTSFDDQSATDYPMPFLSAVGAGASIYTDSSLNEEFTYNPSTGILKVKEFDALSDARLKTDIVRVDDALGKVAQLRGVEYNWKNGSGASVGVIAQEVQEVYPQLVNDNGERLTVNYNGLVGLLIAAVNEMAVELAELKAQK